MCGIAGEIRFDQSFADVRTVADMTEAQSRRGPDGEGIFSLGPRCFGHRRLSIMDLSLRAHQPFVDNGLGLGVVFNGAIYNHHELRAELRERGYQFSSSGDTEVIIKAWHCWGPEALQRFYGMFAFALLTLHVTAWASSPCTTRMMASACISLPPCRRCCVAARWIHP
jgi:asparagine synthase (glutamine-hydrolysing)